MSKPVPCPYIPGYQCSTDPLFQCLSLGYCPLVAQDGAKLTVPVKKK